MEKTDSKTAEIAVSPAPNAVQTVLRKSDRHELPKRASWGSSWEFTFMCIGFSVGLGNVWRFPYLCYKNGGGAFLVPYMILLIAIGIPMLLMEYSIGQYFGAGGLQIFGRFCPLFRGMGLALGIMNAIINVYYSIIIGTAAFYLFNSFRLSLPWASCDNAWNSDNCDTSAHDNSTNESPLNNLLAMMMSSIKDNVNRTKSASEEFYYRGLLGMGSEHNITNIGSVQWKLFGCVVFSWCCIFVFLHNGIKSSGKVAMVAASFPYVMLTVLVIRGVTLAGSFDGVLYFITPQWSKMMDPQIWFAAATQLFFATNLAWGGMVSMASYNPFNYPLMRDTIGINIVNFLTSLYAGVAVFSVIGFMAHETGKDIVDVITSGPGLVFIIYPRAISLMKFAPLLSVLFFFMVFLLGIDSSMVSVETVVAGLCDQFPLLQKYHVITLSTFCLGAMLCAMPMTTQGGMYILQLLDQYAVGLNVFLFAFSQLAVTHWIYGTSRLCQNIKKMLGYIPALPWRVCWKYISPLFIAMVFAFSLMKYERVSYGHYVYPVWADLLGWCVAIITVLPLPATMCYVYYTTDGATVLEKLRIATKPIYGLDDNEAMVVVFDVAQKSSLAEYAQNSALQPSLDCLIMILRRKLFAKAKDKLALVLLGTPLAPATSQPEVTAEADVAYPNVLLASPMDYVREDLLEFVKNSVLPNEEKVGELTDAISLAIDHLSTSMDGVRGFSKKRLVLFCDNTRHFDDDKYVAILGKMIDSNIIFDVIHSPNGAERDRKDVSIEGERNAEAIMKMILMEVAGELTTIRKTVPALRYFTHGDSRSVAWKCHLEITETLFIATCCYTSLGVKNSKSTLMDDAPPEVSVVTDQNTENATLDVPDISISKEPEKVTSNEGMASGRSSRRMSFSATNKDDMVSLTSHCFQTLGFSNCDKLNRDDFKNNPPLLVFADKSDKAASLGFSTLVNAMSETNNAIIVRRIFTNSSPPTIGCLLPHVTNKSECLIYNELPFPDDAGKFTYKSLTRSRPGSLVGRKRKTIAPSAEERTIIEELTQSMIISSALKEENGTVSKETQKRLNSSPYFYRLCQCLDRPSFNPDRPLPGMIRVLRKYADLPPESSVEMSTTELHEAEAKTFFQRLRSFTNKNQNAKRLSTPDVRTSNTSHLGSDAELTAVITEMNIR